MRVPIQSIFSFTDYYKLNLDVEEVRLLGVHCIRLHN